MQQFKKVTPYLPHFKKYGATPTFKFLPTGLLILQQCCHFCTMLSKIKVKLFLTTQKKCILSQGQNKYLKLIWLKMEKKAFNEFCYSWVRLYINATTPSLSNSKYKGKFVALVVCSIHTSCLFRGLSTCIYQHSTHY